MSVHICIASDHLAPNLLFHRQQATDSTVILQSPAMREPAKRLARLLKAEGQPCTQIDISDDDPKQWVDQLLQYAPQWDGSEVWLNATGGTKLMALVAQATLQDMFADELRSVYVDTTNNRFHLIRSGLTSHQPLTARLLLKEHLRLYDLYLRSESSDSDDGRMRASKVMVKECKDSNFQNWLGELNGIASKLMSHYEAGKQGELQLPLNRKPPPAVLKVLTDEHIASWSAEHKSLYLMAAEGDARHADLRWLNGGWIEQWAGAELRDAGLDEVFVGAGIDHGPPEPKGKPQVKNEIDVIAYHRNRLLLLECKTANTADRDKQNNILYKLDSLKTLAGGPLGQGILVSARQVSEADLARAGRERIKVFHGAGLDGLGKFARSLTASLPG